MENELINQGLILMLGGMGTVFVFLTILVVVTSLMSRLVMKFEIGTTRADITDDEIAAITAAVAAHRRK
ncbi:MAG: OadG family transporter subunit [Gammaproteobacteria bacterium]|nr:OadG family transporter subunit [Gammaproteobacteria bacterium]